MLVLSGCRQNAPLSVSNPHFSLADSHYTDQVTILTQTNPTNSYFIVDQRTSIPSEVHTILYTTRVEILLLRIEVFLLVFK